MRRECEMKESVALGDAKKIRLEQGSVRYREVGFGEPVLFGLERAKRRGSSPGHGLPVRDTGGQMRVKIQTRVCP